VNELLIKRTLYILVLLIQIFGQNSFAQNPRIDSLKLILNQTNEDTLKVNILLDLSNSYTVSDSTEAIRFANEAIDLGNRLDFQKGVGYAHKSIGMVY